MKNGNEISKGFNKMKRDSSLKECFHEDENCSNKIIKAHAIQNNRILNEISENGEVLMIGEEWKFLRCLVILKCNV